MKTIKVYEEWKNDWATPDVYVLDKVGDKIYLREHTVGECPVIATNLPEGKTFKDLKIATYRTEEEIKLLAHSNPN